MDMRAWSRTGSRMGAVWAALAVLLLTAAPARADDDPDAVFRALAAYAEWERSERIAGALGGALMGAATIGVGAYVADRSDLAFTPWLVVGSIATGLSVVALIVPGGAERLAHDVSAGTAGHTAEQARSLKVEWEALADEAETERIATAAGAFVLGTAAIASGIAFSSGLGDLERDDRTIVAGLLFGSGAALFVSGIANVLRLSARERSFAEYRAGENAPPALELTAGAGPDGVALGARGMF